MIIYIYIYNCYRSSQQIFLFLKTQNSKVRLDVIKFIYKNKKRSEERRVGKIGCRVAWTWWVLTLFRHGRDVHSM